MSPSEREPRRHGLLALAAAFSLGLASVLAFAPFGVFPLIFVTLAGLYRLLENAPGARGGALIGGAFGFGLFLGGVSWVYVSLSIFGGMPMALAALATVLFCAFLALYPALAGALFVRFAPRPGWRRPLFFAALWTLAEWLRGWIFTGFPWLAVGYAQTPPSPFAGFAPLLGVYGVSFFVALAAAPLSISVGRLRAGKNCGCAQGACPLSPLLAPILIATLGANLQRVEWTQPVGEPIRVALLQGNIPQEMKWRPERFDESLRAYHRLALENPAQLTVLPETALPALLEQLPPAYLEELRALARREQGALLFGIPTGDGKAYTNAAIALGEAGAQRYDKIHLVPFGEFVPPGFRWFMNMAHIPMSDFTAGSAQQAPLRLGELRVAANICYEDAFGEEIIHALPAANLLVNLSNVAWFGDSLAPAQHLQIARMRALETGRVMLRATNTGMTAIVAPDGRVAASLPPFTRGALRGEVRGYAGATPYVRAGNWPIVVICLLLGAFLGRRKRVS